MTEERGAEAVHADVQAYYGGIARAGEFGCGCDEQGGIDCQTMYPVEMLDELPASVTDLSLGCGDAVSGANIQPGETVIDLGSGGGIDCFFAARAAGDTGYVIGVDMTSDMLARARSSAEQLGVSNVEFREGNIEALPVDDACADVVISNCVINLAPDKRPVFGEMYRVLRPGGRVHVSDIVTDGPMSEDLARDSEAWSACIAGALPADEFVAGLEAVGFEAVRLEAGAYVAAAKRGSGMPLSATITARKPR